MNRATSESHAMSTLAPTELPRLEQSEVFRRLRAGEKIVGAHIGPLVLRDTRLCCGLELRRCVLESLEFENVIVEASFELEGCVVGGRVSLRHCKFQQMLSVRETRFSDACEFNGSRFLGRSHFNTAHFERWVGFKRVEFLGRTLFSRSRFVGEVDFEGARFAHELRDDDRGHSFSFNDLVAEQRFHLHRCQFEGASTFTGSRFHDIVEFDGARFGAPVRIKHAQFERSFSLRDARFDDELHLNGTNIGGDLVLQGAWLGGLVNLRAIYGQRNVDLQSAVAGPGARFQLENAHFGRLLLDRELIEGHLESELEGSFETARREFGLLKHAFREINEYDQEDWAYVKEKRMERYSLPLSWRRPGAALRRFGIWLALDLACGYGTKPLNILFTSLILVFAFAATFMAFPSFPEGAVECFAGTRNLRPVPALMLSFRFFANAEVNTVDPSSPSVFLDFLIMTESYLGFFVMMILVVTFSRKVIR